MGLFYTGKGDGGESAVGNKKIDKTSLEIEAVGDLDELNSLVGLIKAENLNEELRNILNTVQENLFIVQANVAEFMFHDENGKPKYPAPKFSEEKVKEMENLIDAYEKEVNPDKKFIISGSNKISAWLDYARAVSRRSERRVLSFHRLHPLSPEILAYMNRLSSLFFAMARVEAKRRGGGESHPTYK